MPQLRPSAAKIKTKQNKKSPGRNLFSGLGRPTALKDAVSSTRVLAEDSGWVCRRWQLSPSSFPHANFPGGSDGKQSACNAGDLGSIPWSRRSPGKGNGYPLKYSCLENSMDRRAWQSMGLQRVGHNWATNRRAHSFPGAGSFLKCLLLLVARAEATATSSGIRPQRRGNAVLCLLCAAEASSKPS